MAASVEFLVEERRGANCEAEQVSEAIWLETGKSKR